MPDLPATTIGLETIAARVGLAMLLGFAIGFEREARDRAAGLRTHMLTAAASATFGILALSCSPSPNPETSAMPTRCA